MSFDSNRFDDLIFRHRQSSDLAWALKQWSNPLFDNREQSFKSKSLIQKTTQINSIITPVHYTSLPRTSEQIKNDVLNSLPLKNTIESSNDPKIDMEKAKTILDEMSHRLNLRTVRFLGFIFAKIFNQVFEHIYIDRDGIEVLYQFYSLTSTPTSPSSPLTISSTLFAILNTFSRSTSNNGENFTSLPSPLTTKHFLTSPRIVYLPTHRSYMDFILLTYLCYDYNIPMPCIAAAQDFLGLGLLSNLLRHCGAFFIRRSFRSDLLYWTIFDEYVKTHLIHGDYPLEFFIEGARSRTLKTLLPVRQGMLKSCLECYFRRQTDNLILIPLAINYEKVLEDNLHANELLGIPKPKESKSGLLKATQILKKSFGSMIVRFAQPIDVHDVFESFRLENENRNENVEFQRSIPRGVEPRFLSQQNGLSHFEQNFLDDLSYRIVNEQQRLTVVFPMALVSFSFLRNSKNRILSVEHIFNEKTILIDENRRVFDYFSSNFQIFWPNETNRDEFSKRLLDIYSDVFDLTSDNQLRLKMTGDRVNDASLMMKLVMYRNTFLHFLAKPTYILLICKTNSQISMPYEQLRRFYCFLVHLFAFEFVYDRFPTDVDSAEDFDKFLSFWIEQNYLLVDNDLSYRLNCDFQDKISLITSPFEQYARAYLTIFEQEISAAETNSAMLIKTYQKVLLTKIDPQNVVSIIAASSNVIANALRTLNFGQKSIYLVELRHLLEKLLEPMSTRLRAKL